MARVEVAVKRAREKTRQAAHKAKHGDVQMGKGKRRKAAGVSTMDPKSAIAIILDAIKNKTFSWEVITAAGFLLNWIAGMIGGGTVAAAPGGTAGGNVGAPELHLTTPLEDEQAAQYFEKLAAVDDPTKLQKVIAIPWALLAQWMITFLAKRFAKNAG